MTDNWHRTVAVAIFVTIGIGLFIFWPVRHNIKIDTIKSITVQHPMLLPIYRVTYTDPKTNEEKRFDIAFRPMTNVDLPSEQPISLTYQETRMGGIVVDKSKYEFNLHSMDEIKKLDFKMPTIPFKLKK